MKKVFSLVVVLFCLVGSVWGQTAPTVVGGKVTPTNVTCTGNEDGTISGTISPGTGVNAPPYNIYLDKNGVVHKSITNTSDLSFEFTGLGPVAQNGYRVRIARTNGSQISPTYYATITEPPVFDFSGVPSIIHENCGTPGSITVRVGGGTAGYTMVITYPDTHTEQKTSPSGTFVFNNLSAGTYLFEAWDANNCGHVTTSATIDPSSSVGGYENIQQHTNVTCFGESTGGFEVIATGTSDLYDFYLNGFYYTSDPVSLVISGYPAGVYEVVVSVGGCLSDIITIDLTQPSSELLLSCDSTRTSCNGTDDGTITATASGGVGIYTYSIFPLAGSQNQPGLFTGLPANNYTITVRDGNDCIKQETVGIGKPTPISFAFDKVDPLCNGESTGSITVKNVTGGTGSYTYALSGTVNRGPQINPDFKNLPAGTYTVTVEDGNHCTKEEPNIVLINPAKLEVDGTPNVKNVTCFGGNDGTITIAAKGGTPNASPNEYTFACSNGITLKGTSVIFTGLTAGTYTITISDKNNCSIIVENLTVSQNSKLYAGIILHENVTCNGKADGKLTAEGKGGDGNYMYVWGNGANTAAITGLTPGSYKVTVTDHGGAVGACSADTTVTITQPVVLAINFSNQVNNVCHGGEIGEVTATPTGGTAPYNFQWSPAPGSVVSTSTVSTAKGLLSKEYTVTVTDTKGCTAEGKVTIDEPAGIDVTATAAKSPLYCTGESTTITVATNPAGVYEYQLNGGLWQDGNTFTAPAGTYSIKVRYKNTGDNCPFAGSTNLRIDGQPANIIFDTGIINNVCAGGNNGSITITNVQPLNVPGEVPPLAEIYEYQFKQGSTILKGFSGDNQITGLSQGEYDIIVKGTITGCESTGAASLVDPKAITLAATPTPVTCPGGNDGKIDLNITGGTGSFNFSILPAGGTRTGSGNHVTFEGLLAGTYKITVSETAESTCTQFIDQVVVAEPKAISFMATATNPKVACKGDKTSIIISDVVAEDGLVVEFSLDQANWQTELTFTDVPANNTNAITVYARYKDRNCPAPYASRQVNITEPTDPLAISTAVDSNPTCHDDADGKATATAIGGWGSYTYWWENSSGVKVFDGAAATGLPGGNYTAYVKDAEGCIQSANVAIQPVDPIAVQPVITTAVSCEGIADGTATVTANGGNGAPYKYAWDSENLADAVSSNIKSDLPAGAHYVVVFDSKDCSSGKINFSIDNRPALIISFNKTDASCDGASDGQATAIISPNDNGNYVYQWTPTAQSTKTATGLAKDTYTVTVAYAESQTCKSTNTVTIDAPTPINVSSVTAAATGLLCANEKTTLTVTASGDSRETLMYSLDGTNWQSSKTFEVSARPAPYIAWVAYKVSDTEVKCAREITEFPVTVSARPAITISSVAVDKPIIPCNETTTKVTITANGENGINGLEYRIDPSAAWQTSNVFNVGAGTYTACVRYTTAPNCPVCEGNNIVITRDIDITIGNVVVSGSPLTCAGDQTATISFTASGNSGPLQYGLKNGANTIWQDNGLFTGLGAGSYEVLARYTSNPTCFQSGGVYIITAPDAIVPGAPEIGQNPLDCAGGKTTVKVDIPGTDIEYSIDGQDWYDAGVTINDVPAGDYQVIARYKNKTPSTDCQVIGQAFSITAPAAIQITRAEAVPSILDCFDKTAEIHIEATGENGYQLEYTINDGVNPPQTNTTGVFYNVPVGSYQVSVRYKTPAAPCGVTGTTIVVTAPAAIQITGFSSNITTLPCNNPTAKATLTITATGGTNKEYSIDDGQTWLANGGNFTGVGVGVYTACVRYAGTDCQVCFPTPVTISSSGGDITSVMLTAVKDKLNCNETSTTLKVTVMPATGSYEYELNNNGIWMSKTELENYPIISSGTFAVNVRYTGKPSCVQASNTVKIVKPNPITAIVNIDEAACHDGQSNITVIATGGLSMLYTLTPATGMPVFSSNGQFTNVPDGTYKLTVAYTDAAFNACSFMQNDIVVSKPAAIAITDVTAAATELQCDNATTTLTVVATDSGKEMEFSLDGTNWYSNGTNSYAFTVGEGTYRAQARYVTLSPDKCTVVADPSMDVTITAWAPIVMAVNPDKTMLECNETTVNVRVTATGEPGKAIEFNANGSWVSAINGEYTFALPAGAYTISARYYDNPNCVVSEALNIDQNINISIDRVTAGSLDCANDVTTIRIEATGDGKNLEYTIDGVKWVQGNSPYTFTNVSAGDYTIGVRYAGETCTRWYAGNPVKITAPDAIQIISVTPASPVNLACHSDMATITINAKGSEPMEYSIRDGEWQSGKTFNDVEGGTYLAKVRYSNGGKCEVTASQAIVVNQPATISIKEVKVGGQVYTAPVELTCNGDLTTIEIVATGDQTRTLEYSINGVDFLPKALFSDIGPGTYHPSVRYRSPDAACTVDWGTDVEITSPDPITANIYAEYPQLACDGTQKTRVIFDITGSDVNRVLEYSIDGSAWVTDTAMLQKVGVGQHTATVRYQGYGCALSDIITVTTDGTIQGVDLSADKLNLNCGEKTTLRVAVNTSDPAKILQYRLRDSSGKVTAWQTSNEFTLKPGGTYVAEASYTDDISCIQYSNPLTVTQPAAIDITDVYVGTSALACNGDMTDIIVTADGHGEALKYILTPEGSTAIENTTGIFNVGAGKYNLSVIYNNTGYCPADYPTIEITEPAAIKFLSVTGTMTVACAGDKAQITVNVTHDSNRPVEYSADGLKWQDDKVLKLGIGTYDQIQVRYKQPNPACPVMYGQTVTITGPAPIVIDHIDLDKNMVDCTDLTDQATITVTATGAGLVYSFDGGLTYQTANSKLVGSGVYNICVAYGDVTTQTCPVCSPDPVVVSSNSDIVIVNTVITGDIQCNGGTTGLTVTVSGSSAIELSLGLDADDDGLIDWFPANSGTYTFTGLVAGKYYVSARYASDPACVKVSGLINITEPDPVELSLVTYTNVAGCKGDTPGTAIVEGLGGSGSYEYSLDNGVFIPMTQNPFTINGLKLGNHTIALRDTKGCNAPDAIQLSIMNPDSMIISYDIVNIRCYGEANGRLTLKVKNGHAPYAVVVINDLGQTIRTGYLANTSDELKFDNLASGFYWVRVTDAKSCEQLIRVQILQPAGPLEVDYIGYNICPLNEYGRIQPQTYGGWPDYVSYWYSRTSDADDYAPMYADNNGNAIGGKVPVLFQIEAGQYQIVVKDQALCTDTTWVNIVKLKDYSATARPHGVRCSSPNSGSVKIVNPQGGNDGPYWFRVRDAATNLPVPGFEMYKYYPNDSIYGLAQGSYLIDMKDEVDVIYPEQYACNPYVIPVTIGVEEGISIQKISVDNADCFDDKAAITAIKVDGTVHPLEYRLEYPDGTISNWQDSQVFGNLSDGKHIVYVREKAGGDGCETKKDTTIVIPAELLINVTVIEPKCEDPVPTLGTVNIITAGGTGQPTVTYNGIEVIGGVQVDPVTNEWTFAQEIDKGGKAMIVVTDKNGCTKQLVIDVPYTPGLQWMQRDNTMNKCPGDEIATITALAESVSGYIPASLTYKLYTGEIAMGTPKETIVKTNLLEAAVFSGLANGTYTVSVHDDKNPHCYTDDWIVEIDNTNKITISDIAIDDNMCNGQLTGAIAFTITGDPSINEDDYYVCTLSNGQVVSVNAVNGIGYPTFAPLPAGTYTVDIAYGECTLRNYPLGEIEEEYVVTPAVKAIPVTGCHGNKNGAIEIQMPNTTGFPFKYWYSGLPDGQFDSFTPNPNGTKTTITGLAADSYDVIVRNKNGCLSNTITVVVDDALPMQIDTVVLTPITCKGQYGKIKITISGGKAPYTVKVAEKPDYAKDPVLTGSGSEYILDQVTGGLYKISVEDASGCANVLELDIYAPRVVEILVTQPAITCATSPNQNTTVTVQVIKPTSGTFEYIMNNGSPEITTSLTHIYAVPTGTYKFEVKEQGSGCLADTSIAVKIPQPMMLSLPVTKVDHGNCHFTANMGINITGGTAPFTIKVNNTTIPATNSTILEGLPANSYHVEVWDANNCYVDMTVKIELPTTITVAATIRDVKCNQDGKGSIVVTPATYTYNWEDGSTGNALYDLNAGDYKVNISNGSGCSIDTVFTVKASYTIDVAITVDGEDTHIFCPGVDVVLNGLVTINGTPMSSTTSDAFANWILPNGETKEYLTNNPLILTATNGTIQLTASSGGCTSMATFDMETKPTPTLAFATDTVYIPKDEAYTLKMDASDYASYQWTSTPDANYAQGLPAPPADVTLASPDAPYTLTLTLTGENGCSISDAIYVSRALEFFIPNAFTPNDDGNHDTWKFRNIEQYIDYYDIQVAVFNRGGFQVYSGKGYNNSSVVWDGRRNGNDLPIGTYYYVVKLVPKSSTSTTHTFKGSVTIIR